MNDSDAPKPVEDSATAEAAPSETPETGAEAVEEPSNEELASLRILEMEAEIKVLKDQDLRTRADMENLRRRTEREMRDARAYAVSNFAKEVLGVADNLNRALQALPADARSGGDATLTSLVEGIELTQRELIKALDKNGVAEIQAQGSRFDPNLHQAMFEVPNKDVPNNTVVQVVQTGYTIGERVLRPAMVGVAKGGPKQPAPAADSNADQPDADAAVDRTA